MSFFRIILVGTLLLLLSCSGPSARIGAPAQPSNAENDETAAPVAGAHQQLSCDDCHKSHTMIPPVQNDAPCIKCHDDQTGDNSHPTGVAHKGEPPEGLPLSKDGKLTCTTCHVLHETDSPAPVLLRMKFNDLCRACHYSDKPSEGHPKHSE